METKQAAGPCRRRPHPLWPLRPRRCQASLLPVFYIFVEIRVNVALAIVIRAAFLDPVAVPRLAIVMTV